MLLSVVVLFLYPFFFLRFVLNVTIVCWLVEWCFFAVVVVVCLFVFVLLFL